MECIDSNSYCDNTFNCHISNPTGDVILGTVYGSGSYVVVVDSDVNMGHYSITSAPARAGSNKNLNIVQVNSGNVTFGPIGTSSDQYLSDPEAAGVQMHLAGGAILH